MKALCWHGKHDMRLDTVPDPKIEHPRDAIIKVTACAICGSDLHIYNGVIPDMKHGDVIGHFELKALDRPEPGGRRFYAYDFFQTELKFTQATFDRLWGSVFDFCVNAP